ncbi:hypothetical protein N657DRAFT_570540 [Parathielavia appendiculata]|uniref:DASH complex subunit SPC19 n=1 Tax=Parathielavia appendiculata TaxID=2587402 RepID=A0AAN6U2H9_9PEZI|nr:hypothetical protein N657DRAFT_570540 [Parathielavia appendiculata]
MRCQTHHLHPATLPTITDPDLPARALEVNIEPLLSKIDRITGTRYSPISYTFDRQERPLRAADCFSRQTTMSIPPFAPTYADCVTSLRTSLSLLESSVATLGTGVQDFPRLSSVLKTVRHYELIPQPTLAAAEASLRDEIGPFVARLLDRADKHLEKQARRIETLKARAELNAGRLSHLPGPDDDNMQGGAGIGKGRRLDGGAALRAKVVRQRKEALKYSVERLELEVLQKERELRMRLEQA